MRHTDLRGRAERGVYGLALGCQQATTGLRIEQLQVLRIEPELEWLSLARLGAVAQPRDHLDVAEAGARDFHRGGENRLFGRNISASVAPGLLDGNAGCGLSDPY
jgi:hypothetical protein